MSKRTRNIITLTVLGSVLLGSLIGHRKKKDKLLVRLNKKLGKTIDSVSDLIQNI